VLLAGIIAALAWFGWKWYKKFRQGQGEAEEIVNPDPAHVIAFRQLEKLKQENLWQNGEIKLYYTRLTEILRYYLENRYRIYSLELTTQETLDALVRSGFKKDATYTQLKNILTGADLVKFAKYNPEQEEHETAFQESLNFVMATREASDPIVADDVNEAKGEVRS